MKGLTTLEKVNSRIDEMSKFCNDKHIDVSDISFDSLETMKIGNNRHTLRPIAQKSILWRLGIPHSYIQRCSAEIQKLNMNYWIQFEKQKQLFVRFDNNEIRAIFTPRYIPTDHFEIMLRLDEMGYGPETKCQCFLDDQFMLLNIPDSKKTFQINGDQMTPGISLQNSETGMSSLSASLWVYRLICQNGLVVKEELSKFAYRHVSSKILDKLPEVFREVENELSKQKNRIEIAMQSKVEDPLKTIESFNRQFNLNQSQKEAVEWAFPQEAGDTMFAVVNTYTRAAQFKGLSAENSYQLQRVGGNILGMLN
jgi:hypothetical protein